MNMEKPKEATTSTSETNTSDRITVNVPVTVTIKIPVKIDVPIPQENMEESTEFGCMVVDPSTCPDAVAAALVAAQSDETCNKAFDGLMSAALRFKDSFSEVDVYVTPFAGIIKETKL